MLNKMESSGRTENEKNEKYVNTMTKHTEKKNKSSMENNMTCAVQLLGG